jgi:asparagine synthase (glutamine-hydrolysing)
MSAIAGIICFDGKIQPKAECQRMLDRLAVYARDGSALWDADRAALGLCKMRVLPEDQFDRQPIVDAERGLVLVADARIDNRDELRSELGIDRAETEVMADADFIMAAFSRWGEDCLYHLIGDFAFAVYDSRNGRLFCARDHVGARPLFYHVGAGFAAFASMPAGLLALPQVSPTLDEDSLARDLLLLPLKPGRTFFLSLSILPPASCAVVTSTETRVRRHWNPADAKLIRLGSDGEYVEAFREIFDEAVRCRLRSAGALGAHLSAGLDSSSVTVTAARMLGETGRKLTAFTAVPHAGFEGSSIANHFNDEGPRASAAAARYPNIEHVLIRAGGRSFMDHLERDQRLMGAPARNPLNLVWLDAISEEASRRGLRVMLSGMLGNVTISYTGTNALSGMFRSGRWRTLVCEARALMRVQQFSLLGVCDLAIGPSLPAPTRRWIQRIRKEKPWNYSAINRAFAERHGLIPWSQAHFYAAYGRPLLDSRGWRVHVLATSGGGAYYMRDCALGIDSRDPTADRRVVEFCLGIPDAQFLHDGVSRRLVRRAMADALPRETLAERAKGLQSADWYEGMTASKAEIAEELRLMERSATARRIIDLPRLRALMANWPAASPRSSEYYVDYCLALARGVGAGNFINCAEKK